MSRIIATFGIAVRRGRANWKLLSTAAVGAVLSAALMASVVLYSDTVRDLGLKHALETQDQRTLDLKILQSVQPVQRQEYAVRTEATTSLVRAYTGDILASMVRYGRSATFFPTAPGGTPTEDQQRPRAHFQFIDNLKDHVRLVKGAAPGPPKPATDTTPPQVEVWMGSATAAKFGLDVGDRLDLHPHWRKNPSPVAIVIVGLIHPTDAAEGYWFGNDRFSDDTSWPTYPFFIDESVLTNVLAPYLPDMDYTAETFAFFDTGSINSRNAEDIAARILTLESTLGERVEHTLSQTSLPRVIAQYQSKLFFTRLPLVALMVQVVGIALYYLVMVATMLVERQTGEIALLRSRGASTFQVMTVFAAEAGLLSVAAVVIGPLAAAGAIALLGPTPPFRDLSGGSTLSVPISVLSFEVAAVGALLAWLAMLLPAYQACRTSMVDYRHRLARPPVQPVFLRYYLDLVLIVAAGFVFYELRQRGSLVTEKLFGDLSADPLLLISPTLFMLMVALLFLRLFPLALRMVAFFARRLAGPTIALGLWRMVRSPLHYSRLILLLLLATAVGMFAAGFRSTLDRGYDDRAAYQSGAEGRIEGIRSPPFITPDRLTTLARDTTSATGVAAVSRTRGTYSIEQFRTVDVTVLGVNPADFAPLAFWRDDFAGPSLGGLLGRLKPPWGTEQPAAATVPGGARYIGAWIQNPLAANAGQLGLRLQDREGVYWEYRLATATPTPGAWQFYVADLTRPSRNRGAGAPALAMGGPKRLDSIFVRLTGMPPVVAERLSLLVDDVQVSSLDALPAGVAAAGFSDGALVDDFESIDRYEAITGVTVNEAGGIGRADATGRTGAAARISFSRGRNAPTLVGLRLKTPQDPLPVAVSESYLERTGKGPGDEILLFINQQYVRMRIAGSFGLFPTFNPSQPGVLFVADRAGFEAAASRVPSVGDGIPANEVWLSGFDNTRTTAEALTKGGLSADRVYVRSNLRAQQSSDPLVAASWEGILFLAFAAVLGLTAIGFAVYAVLAAQARSLEFAILRSMGFTGRQILGLVSFEIAFVIVAGVGVGTLLGFPLGRLMIGYLGINESGGDPLPPLVSQVSWPAVLTVYGLFAIVFAGTLLGLTSVYARLAVHRALRAGEA